MSRKTAPERRCVILSGCSGGGKSTLLEELSRHGLHTVREAGRQIVQQELAVQGTALPWQDTTAFVRKAVALSQHQIAAEQARAGEGLVITDRSVVDTISYLDFCGLETPPDLAEILETSNYNPTVFFTPPWEDLFTSDSERPKNFPAAVSEYRHLEKTYARLGYHIIELPKTSLAERCRFLEEKLESIAL